MLDPDPDEMNADQQPCLELLLQVAQLLQLLVVLVPAPAQGSLLPALCQLNLHSTQQRRMRDLAQVVDEI